MSTEHCLSTRAFVALTAATKIRTPLKLKEISKIIGKLSVLRVCQGQAYTIEEESSYTPSSSA